MIELEEASTNQFLTFKLGPEVYALDVTNAREILEYSTPTQLPQTPDWIQGVINVRGNVVPVVDLKKKFGLPPTDKTVNTCIIMVELKVKGQLVVIGALADSVQEVFEMEAEQIEETPSFGTSLSTKFIRGMGRRNNQLFIILDADKVFSDEEVSAVVQGVDESAALVDDAAIPEARPS